MVQITHSIDTSHILYHFPAIQKSGGTNPYNYHPNRNVTIKINYHKKRKKRKYFHNAVTSWEVFPVCRSSEYQPKISKLWLCEKKRIIIFVIVDGESLEGRNASSNFLMNTLFSQITFTRKQIESQKQNRKTKPKTEKQKNTWTRT